MPGVMVFCAHPPGQATADVMTTPVDHHRRNKVRECAPGPAPTVTIRPVIDLADGDGHRVVHPHRADGRQVKPAPRVPVPGCHRPPLTRPQGEAVE